MTQPAGSPSLSNALLLSLLLCLSGCVLFPKTTVPIGLDINGSPAQADRLVVMLPGFGDPVSMYREQGFLDEIHHFGDKTAFVALDAHIGYYREKSLIDRARNDVFENWPNSRVTLVGASLGGLGAGVLGYHFSQRVDEVVLIAPFLGNAKFVKRVQGGNFNSRPGDSPKDQALLWSWDFLVNSPEKTAVTILIGESDRSLTAAKVLQSQAPHVRIITRPGGHKWKVWYPLWQTYLTERNP